MKIKSRAQVEAEVFAAFRAFLESWESGPEAAIETYVNYRDMPLNVDGCRVYLGRIQDSLLLHIEPDADVSFVDIQWES